MIRLLIILKPLDKFIVCLTVACRPDVVWLLFLMKDMSNLDLATRMLGSVERGFQKAHGEGLERLTALKGEYCAEKLLYVRLHLLQVGFLMMMLLGVFLPLASPCFFCFALRKC